MRNKEERNLGTRILPSISSLVVIGALIYMFIAGADMASSIILVSALGGIVGPAIVAGEGVLEILGFFFEIFLEGILGIFEGIANIFGSIFG